MIWRTCGSVRRSSARRAYSTRAVGFIEPAATSPRYCGVSASSRSSRSPRASLVAVPSDGIRSPRISREIVEWSTPDCWASCRCDIFLALSWARSHSLNARPFWVVISERALRPDRPMALAGDTAMAQLSIGPERSCITRWYRRRTLPATPESRSVWCGRAGSGAAVAGASPGTKVRGPSFEASRTAIRRSPLRRRDGPLGGGRGGGGRRRLDDRAHAARLGRDHVGDRARGR